MKVTKTMFLALAAGTLLACSSSVRAQDSTNTPPSGQRPPGGKHGGLSVDRLSKALDLTDAQKTQVGPVLEDQTKQMQALRADTSLSPEDRRAKMKTIRETFITKMKAILTPDQFAKFEKMTQRRKAPPAGDAGTPPQN